MSLYFGFKDCYEFDHEHAFIFITILVLKIVAYRTVNYFSHLVKAEWVAFDGDPVTPLATVKWWISFVENKCSR